MWSHLEGSRTDKHNEHYIFEFEAPFADLDPLTMRDTAATDGLPNGLKELGLRPRMPNILFTIPFADPVHGVFGSTPCERLHVFMQGIFQYLVESFHAIIGEKNQAATTKRSTMTTFVLLLSISDDRVSAT
jgi:hypothetical protein